MHAAYTHTFNAYTDARDSLNLYRAWARSRSRDIFIKVSILAAACWLATLLARILRARRANRSYGRIVRAQSGRSSSSHNSINHTHTHTNTRRSLRVPTTKAQITSRTRRRSHITVWRPRVFLRVCATNKRTAATAGGCVGDCGRRVRACPRCDALAEPPCKINLGYVRPGWMRTYTQSDARTAEQCVRAWALTINAHSNQSASATQSIVERCAIDLGANDQAHTVTVRAHGGDALARVCVCVRARSRSSMPEREYY